MAVLASDGVAPLHDMANNGGNPRSAHWPTEKGQGRSFGVIFPRAFAEGNLDDFSWRPRTEFLVQAVPGRCDTPLLDIRLQFLQQQECCCHPEGSSDGRGRWAQGDLCLSGDEASLDCEGPPGWQEPLQREVKIMGLPLSMLLKAPGFAVHEFTFAFPSTMLSEPVRDESGAIIGMTRRRQAALEGCLEVAARPAGPELFNITVSVVNCTRLTPLTEADPEAVALHALEEAYLLLDFTEPCIAETVRALHQSSPGISVEVS